jgi:hypothetical protein
MTAGRDAGRRGKKAAAALPRRTVHVHMIWCMPFLATQCDFFLFFSSCLLESTHFCVLYFELLHVYVVAFLHFALEVSIESNFFNFD